MSAARDDGASGTWRSAQEPVLAIRDFSVVYRTKGGDVRAVDQVKQRRRLLAGLSLGHPLVRLDGVEDLVADP